MIGSYVESWIPSSRSVQLAAAKAVILLKKYVKVSYTKGTLTIRGCDSKCLTNIMETIPSDLELFVR